jgi:adenylate cyclase
MFVAQAIGSIFNISYNLTHIPPLLSPAQEASFKDAIGLFHALAYPPLVMIWAFAVFRLRLPIPDATTLARQQRAVINLPFVAALVAAAGWLLSIPAIFLGFMFSGDGINRHVYFHFPVSICIAAAVALTIGYCSIDWARQKLLFPFFAGPARAAPREPSA